VITHSATTHSRDWSSELSKGYHHSQRHFGDNVSTGWMTQPIALKERG